MNIKSKIRIKEETEKAQGFRGVWCMMLFQENILQCEKETNDKLQNETEIKHTGCACPVNS